MLTPYYTDELVTIYHGRAEEILPQLPKPDLLLTDPQYQLANGGKATTMNATAKRGRKHLKGTITIPDCARKFAPVVAPDVMRSLPLMYEDQLPEDMTDAEYDEWFLTSSIVDGVRMGKKFERQ